ncbi:MAG: hypothetical protein H6839_13130 [Planctomycetes bacterium]|nr:hypothetical protein [Planctomycetota bacterium]
MRVDTNIVKMPDCLMPRLQEAADSGMSDSEVLSILWSMTPRPLRTPDCWADILNELFGVPQDLAIRASSVDAPVIHFRANMHRIAEALWPWLHRVLRGADNVATVAAVGLDTRRQFAAIREEMDGRARAVVPRSRKRFEAAVREAYRIAGYEPPPMLWFNGIGSGSLFLNMCCGEGANRKNLIARLPCTDAEPNTHEHLLKQAFDGLRSVLADMDEGECLRRISRRRIGPSVLHRMNVKLLRPVEVRRDPVRSRRLSSAVLEETAGAVAPRLEIEGSVQSVVIGAMGESLDELAGRRPGGTALFHGIFLEQWARLAGLVRCNRAAGMDPAPALAYLQDIVCELVDHGYWFFPGEKLCIACDGPTSVHFEDGLLHNRSAAAVEFADGLGAFALGGFYVPSFVVREPESITVRRIRGERNAEVRRIMIDVYGRGRYLSETGAKVVDMDMVDVVAGDASFGAMPRALMRDRDGDTWLVGTDGSTRRVCYMRVPPAVRSCSEAHKRLAGMDECEIIASS